MKFSANLGFLWTDFGLPNAIRAAKAAGFDAVECHWPYDVPAKDIAAVLDETGLPIIALNTRRGDVDRGEMGLAAVVGQEVRARASIDEAIEYALMVGAQKIHVMSGNAAGDKAYDTFLQNLSYGIDQVSGTHLQLLIEPLNRFDAPDYFLRKTDQALNVLGDLNSDAVQIMFDCYHVQITEGDVTRKLTQLRRVIGHIQIASVPDRGTPDHGELDYAHVIQHLIDIGWDTPLGAEYRPDGLTDRSLEWMRKLRGI